MSFPQNLSMKILIQINQLLIDHWAFGPKTDEGLRGFLGRRHVKKKGNDCFDGENLKQR